MATITKSETITIAKPVKIENEAISTKYIDDGTPYKMEIVWKNVFIFTTLHIFAVIGMFYAHDLNWKLKLYVLINSLLINFGVTAANHRYFTHRSFKANTWARLLFIMLSSQTYQNSIYIWARDHRVHHRYSETNADPHNAKRGFFFSHIGWLMVKKHPDVFKYGKHIDMSDLENDRLVMLQHRFYYLFVIVFSFVVPMFICVILCDNTLWSSLTLSILMMTWSLHFTWSVNSFAHLQGTKVYSRFIGPVQNYLVSIVTNGEGYHNYHHIYPWDYKASEHTSDPSNCTTAFIDLLAKIGWVTERKAVPPEIVAKHVQRYGDVPLWRKNSKTPKRQMHNIMWHVIAWLTFYKFICYTEFGMFYKLINYAY